MNKSLHAVASPGHFARTSLAGIILCSMMFSSAVPAVSFARQGKQARDTTPPITNNARANSEGDDAAALYQSLLDLQNPWTVMCVAAHPDDEDGATLTILRRKYGVHTVSLFSTYGEGGQNAVGPELYEELGAIRARETMEAAEVQGSEPHFLALRDFGFSKSADEAFRVWNHDEALRRMVYQIRLLRPDVIITNHDTVSGHGHHQATGRLVLEAFDAAADPARFPEQLRGSERESRVSTWQAQRLFVRSGFDGGAAGSKPLEDEAARANTIIAYDANERDAVRGTTYAEQALEALRHHATQGPWPRSFPAGARIICYRLTRSAKDAAAFPAHAQTFLDGLQLPEQVAAKIAPPKFGNRPLTDFINERQRVFYALAGAQISNQYVVPETDTEAPRFHLMQERLNRALAAASGITATLTPRDKVVIPNSTATFSLDISNSGNMKARVQSAALPDFVPGRGKKSIITGLTQISTPYALLPNTTFKLAPRYNIPADTTLTVPHAAHLYDGRVFGEPFTATATININDVSFPLTATTRVDVAPAVEITNIAPSPFVLTPSTLKHPPSLDFQLVNHLPTPSIARLDAKSSTYSMTIFSDGLTLKANEVRNVVKPFGYLTSDAYVLTGKSLKPMSDTVTFTIHRSINAGELIAQKVIKVVYSDAYVAPNLRVGYVRSSDETLRNALAALGVESKELTIDDVRANDLSHYDTIIIDNRGYQAHPELIALNQRLLDYARAGGNLVVFYHKTNEWNPDAQKNRTQLAPYPITLGNERVTDETAPIAFLEANNALLNYPNKITQDDFKDWIQERGLYYPNQWDAHYTAIFATNDPGEQPLRGGLLATDYGRGHYIYTSMVWYRQLRAGVPGAYRMFANMISYGHASSSGVKQTGALKR